MIQAVQRSELAEQVELWPPNKSYVDFSAKDCFTSLEAATPSITGVWSDEPEDASGGKDGNTTDDIVYEDGSFSLRAERSASGNGRFYGIELQVADSSGNISSGVRKLAIVLSRGSCDTFTALLVVKI